MQTPPSTQLENYAQLGVEIDGTPVQMGASSDFGNVSQELPAAMFLVETHPSGIPWHSAEAAALSGDALALRGMLTGAKVLAVPSARAKAHELSVDLADVQGPGRNGVIRRTDVEAFAAEREQAAEVAAAIEDDFEFFHQALFQQRSGRMLRVNELLATGDPFTVPPSLIPLLDKAQALSTRSGGLFNPALGRLTRRVENHPI